MSLQFSLGIDLGTSNSAAAIEELDSGRGSVVEVTQITGPKQIGEKPTLPSALYLPHPDEFPGGSLQLPWATGAGQAVVGHFARDHGALVPDRLVTSAKSWLSNFHTDPRKPVLPWNSAIAETKLSAFDCSRLYLEHLREGFLAAERSQGRERDLAEGQVVITVPASFDEVARALTSEAAEAAGLGRVVLLEEPQAAFYAWTAQAGSDWRKQVAAGDIVLVCDVGGGTADFSLIAITGRDGALELERISVGEHLLLGGDNMDLALAYTLQAQLEDDGKAIDDWQFLALVHAAGRAKVQLFNDASIDEVPIAVPSRGSGLFAKTVSTRLGRATLEAVVLDGFFPLTPVTELPEESAGTGLQEFGLPYAADPVVSKHLARFLTRSLLNVRASESLTALVGTAALEGQSLQPSAVLFNGGVFNAAPLRQRVLDLLASWGDGRPVRELEGFQPDLAVAKGAAIYGRNRATGQGLRIKAGTARSYYIGLQSTRPAVPGFKPPIKALCVVPQGMEEGSEFVIEGQEFGLTIGRPAVFRFFASEVRSGDTPGQIIANAERELEETSQLEVTLPAIEGFPEGQAVPVLINPLVTEVGRLELWMKHTGSDHRWKVEFQVRTE
ncbi:Hsp70 family protein [Luteolibacter marinus]|uniref:Hsp70 family protein n=1 Tax=Luteolibacter marinus TaxID=2776705 RepID=UPI0018669D62|nr:Hsp70 family protein [Luteolibacter marinus]